jgi:hypothetical protein
MMLKGIFSLTLRTTQGLLDSLSKRMNVPLCAPNYSNVSKLAHTLRMTYRQPSQGSITNLVIDSADLKVFGEGECGECPLRPTLLNHLRRKLGRVYADNTYDNKARHQMIARKGTTSCIKNARHQEMRRY